MGGRSRGNQERILVLAHQTEMFARQKTLKPLREYLRHSMPAKADAADVLALLTRTKGVKITHFNTKP
jgi:hypothetical protein